MLRLWPEVVVAGISPELCWLRRGGRTVRVECGTGAAAQLTALRDLLAAEQRRFGRLAWVDVYVSDSYARLAMVPWQDNLITVGQTNAYGRAILESKGLPIEEEWSTHTGFRHFGAPGMATALPLNMVEQLKEVFAAGGLRLRSILPVSAAVYWYHRPVRRKGTSILLFAEPGRLSAATYQAGRFYALDVEPTMGQIALAASRLEKRVKLRFQEIHLVEALAPSVAEWRAEHLARTFDMATVIELPRAKWSAV